MHTNPMRILSHHRPKLLDDRLSIRRRMSIVLTLTSRGADAHNRILAIDPPARLVVKREKTGSGYCWLLFLLDHSTKLNPTGAHCSTISNIEQFQDHAGRRPLRIGSARSACLTIGNCCVSRYEPPQGGNAGTSLGFWRSSFAHRQVVR